MSDLWPQVRDELLKERERLREMIATGVQDWSQYQRAVGNIAGLDHALVYAKDLMTPPEEAERVARVTSFEIES